MKYYKLYRRNQTKECKRVRSDEREGEENRKRVEEDEDTESVNMSRRMEGISLDHVQAPLGRRSGASIRGMIG
jgi:hypothetical protein